MFSSTIRLESHLFSFLSLIFVNFILWYIFFLFMYFLLVFYFLLYIRAYVFTKQVMQKVIYLAILMLINFRVCKKLIFIILDFQLF
jgi:hypothetical protein